jgi:hypothetical protein
MYPRLTYAIAEFGAISTALAKSAKARLLSFWLKYGPPPRQIGVEIGRIELDGLREFGNRALEAGGDQFELHVLRVFHAFERDRDADHGADEPGGWDAPHQKARGLIGQVEPMADQLEHARVDLHGLLERAGAAASNRCGN